MSPDPAVTEAPPPGTDDAVDAPAEAHDRPSIDHAEPAPPPPVREPAPSPATDAAATGDGANGAQPVRPRLVTTDDLSRRQRRQAARLRARKVKRIVRRLDAWSVLKVSFLFYSCVYVVSMVSAVILWNVAAGAGVIDNVESFIEDLGAFETFEFVPDELLRGVLLGGAVLAVLATGLTALGSVLFNLISDLVGGIRVTVIEEPGARPAMRPRKTAKTTVRATEAPRSQPDE